MDHSHSPDKSGIQRATQSPARATINAASAHPYWCTERWAVTPNPRFTWDESPVVFRSTHIQSETPRPFSSSSSFQTPIHPKTTPAQHIQQDEDSKGAEKKQPEEGANKTKHSRYLREMDRRDILSRLEDGARQCDLAKEYDVSPAAISNLFKHRVQVFSRQDEDPLSMHPKKSRAQTSETTLRNTMDPSRDLKRRLQASMMSRNADIHRRAVHKVDSRSISLLITTLYDRRVSIDLFRGHANRLLRSLLEEALAFVPFRSVDVGLAGDATKPGFTTEFAPCAVSMEKHGTPMLDQFHSMEPDRPTGVLEIRPATTATIPSSVRFFSSLLPVTLEQLNVFLLAPLAVSSQEICLALETLLAEQADESKVLIVCVVVSAEVIATVCHRFPRVRILTAEIDTTPLLTSNSNNPDSSAWCQLLVDRWASAYSTFHSPMSCQ